MEEGKSVFSSHLAQQSQNKKVFLMAEAAFFPQSIDKPRYHVQNTGKLFKRAPAVCQQALLMATADQLHLDWSPTG